MKGFNIDCHVSVIEDVADNLKALGHSVESHLMSGHAWALKKPKASRGNGDPKLGGQIGYGCVNVTTWERMFWGDNATDATFAIARKFADENPELDDFDFFVATYPPSFSLLYEKFHGHVIIDIPVRYEAPFTNAPELWRKFNGHLIRGVNDGKITLIANSGYDALYTEFFTGSPVLHISSTCEYIDRFAPKWSIDRCEGHFWSFGEHAGGREAAKNVPGVKFIRDAGDYYTHADILKARGIVWIPYNASIMSFFEHYWLGIPLFVPTKRFLVDLWDRSLALSQMSWHDPQTGGSHIEGAAKYLPLPDPNTTVGVIEWLDYHDFYNTSELPHVTYFDSWNELADQIHTVDLTAISQAMMKQNRRRKSLNLMKWRSVMERVR